MERKCGFLCLLFWNYCFLVIYLKSNDVRFGFRSYQRYKEIICGHSSSGQKYFIWSWRTKKEELQWLFITKLIIKEMYNITELLREISSFSLNLFMVYKNNYFDIIFRNHLRVDITNPIEIQSDFLTKYTFY